MTRYPIPPPKAPTAIQQHRRRVQLWGARSTRGGGAGVGSGAGGWPGDDDTDEENAAAGPEWDSGGESHPRTQVQLQDDGDYGGVACEDKDGGEEGCDPAVEPEEGQENQEREGEGGPLLPMSSPPSPSLATVCGP